MSYRSTEHKVGELACKFEGTVIRGKSCSLPGSLLVLVEEGQLVCP